MNGKDKNLLSSSDQCKFYSGDCYIFQYAFPGEEKEEYLIGAWLGKKSIEVILHFEFFFSLFTNHLDQLLLSCMWLSYLKFNLLIYDFLTIQDFFMSWHCL